jgi:hypothetical protein
MFFFFFQLQFCPSTYQVLGSQFGTFIENNSKVKLELSTPELMMIPTLPHKPTILNIGKRVPPMPIHKPKFHNGHVGKKARARLNRNLNKNNNNNNNNNNIDVKSFGASNTNFHIKNERF